MASRIFALLIWAAVAASLAYWGLRWLAQPTSVPPNATPVSLDGGAQGDLHRLLAGPAQPASGVVANPSEASALAARLKLLGVVAPRQEGDNGGVALLSIDGKPPRAVRIGSVVDGDMVLLSLTQRGAAIGPASGPASVNLSLPPLPPPATGALPPVGGFSSSASVASPDGSPPPPQVGQAMPAARGRLSSPEGGQAEEMRAPMRDRDAPPPPARPS